MDDRNIIQLLWQRAEGALDALAKKFGRRLMMTAMNILGNPQDAEEAVNATYIALWNTIPPERPDPLEGYVHRTGRNIASGGTAPRRLDPGCPLRRQRHLRQMPGYSKGPGSAGLPDTGEGRYEGLHGS